MAWTHVVKIEFTISKAKSIADARAVGEAIFEHVFETFNDDNSIHKNGIVSVEAVRAK